MTVPHPSHSSPIYCLVGAPTVGVNGTSVSDMTNHNGAQSILISRIDDEQFHTSTCLTNQTDHLHLPTNSSNVCWQWMPMPSSVLVGPHRLIDLDMFVPEWRRQLIPQCDMSRDPLSVFLEHPLHCLGSQCISIFNHDTLTFNEGISPLKHWRKPLRKVTERETFRQVAC